MLHCSRYFYTKLINDAIEYGPFFREFVLIFNRLFKIGRYAYSSIVLPSIFIVIWFKLLRYMYMHMYTFIIESHGWQINERSIRIKKADYLLLWLCMFLYFFIFSVVFVWYATGVVHCSSLYLSVSFCILYQDLPLNWWTFKQNKKNSIVYNTINMT